MHRYLYVHKQISEQLQNNLNAKRHIFSKKHENSFKENTVCGKVNYQVIKTNGRHQSIHKR